MRSEVRIQQQVLHIDFRWRGATNFLKQTKPSSQTTCVNVLGQRSA